MLTRLEIIYMYIRGIILTKWYPIIIKENLVFEYANEKKNIKKIARMFLFNLN